MVLEIELALDRASVPVGSMVLNDWLGVMMTGGIPLVAVVSVRVVD